MLTWSARRPKTSTKHRSASGGLRAPPFFDWFKAWQRFDHRNGNTKDSSSCGRYLDGEGGACRVRLEDTIFQSEPSFTSTRIQLPVTVSPGFIFGFLL